MVLCINPERGFCWRRVRPEYVSPTKFNEIINGLKADKEIAEFEWINMNIKYRRISNSWSVFDSEDRKEIRVNRELNVEIEKDEEGTSDMRLNPG